MIQFIKLVILFIADILIKSIVLTNIYNWFIPNIFISMPIISYSDGITISILLDFILCNKADHIYSEDTSSVDMFMHSIATYLIYLLIAYIAKLILF